jgi:ABC-2 type transport system permease protein
MMADLLRAETLKLRTIRTPGILAFAVLVVVVGAVTSTAATSTFSPLGQPARHVLAVAGPVQTVALLLGVLAVTTEYRHATITPALLITPRRTRLLMAKLVVLAVAGGVLGLAVFGAAAATGLPVLAARHIPSGLGAAGLAGIVAGGAVSTALFATLGVGFGAVVRSQVGAVVTALGLLYAVEPLLGTIPGAGDAVQRFGLAGLASAATATTAFLGNARLLSEPAAIGLLAAYAGVLMAGGLMLFAHRDLAGQPQ